MASQITNPSTSNLATLLRAKRKMASKNSNISDGTIPAPAATGAHSVEKINYRPDVPVGGNPQIPETTTTAPTEPHKVSRKTKQLEVELLDKRMEEINRKQEEKTNQTLDTWKGFDSFNYGFTPNPGNIQPNSKPPTLPKQVNFLF